MPWEVRNFIPGSNKPREFFSVESYDDEAEALIDYQDRANSIRDSGGGVALFSPSGQWMASTSRPIGGGK